MLLPGFSAGGGISGASSPGDINVTATVSPIFSSPLRPQADSSLLLLAGLAALVFVLTRKKG